MVILTQDEIKKIYDVISQEKLTFKVCYESFAKLFSKTEHF